MDRQSIVQDVVVSHDGTTHTAYFFVQGEFIHANIGGRVILAPLSGMPAEDTVRALMTELLVEKDRMRSNAKGWANAIANAPSELRGP